jgi:hypothetical protein
MAEDPIGRRANVQIRPLDEEGMNLRLLRTLVLVALVSGSSLALPAFAAGMPPVGPAEITNTPTGQRLAKQTAERQSSRLHAQTANLRVWRLGPDDYLIGTEWPRQFKSEMLTDASGMTTISMSYDVGGRPSASNSRITDGGSVQAAWSYISGACFTRLQNAYGWLDSCYQVHKLTGESDQRDFYKLEQYGSEGAKILGKIYAGSLGAVKASSSSAMSWIDWNPRATLTGHCQTVPLSVSALGVSYSASGLMCERWNMYKYEDAGHYRQEWSCGCAPGFGQPYPNVREIDYLQVVSVLNGRSPIWTLSASYQAWP